MLVFPDPEAYPEVSCVFGFLRRAFAGVRCENKHWLATASAPSNRGRLTRLSLTHIPLRVLSHDDVHHAKGNRNRQTRGKPYTLTPLEFDLSRLLPSLFFFSFPDFAKKISSLSL